MRRKVGTAFGTVDNIQLGHMCTYERKPQFLAFYLFIFFF